MERIRARKAVSQGCARVRAKSYGERFFRFIAILSLKHILIPHIRRLRLMIQNRATFIRRAFVTDCSTMHCIEYCPHFSPKHLSLIPTLVKKAKEHIALSIDSENLLTSFLKIIPDCLGAEMRYQEIFANIDQAIPFRNNEKYIPDNDIVWLISIIVQSFHSGTLGVGLPLGNLTSQLLVNIYMNEFDQFMKHQNQGKTLHSLF